MGGAGWRWIQGLALALLALPPGMAQAGHPREPALARALEDAGENRPGLERALREAPAEHRDALAFLLAHMPRQDLRSLGPGFLLDNAALAYEAWTTAPWGPGIPREVFLNDVLPYASLTEPRDGSRGRLREIALPLVAGCRTPAEAAEALNRTLFTRVGVVYGNRDVRADAAPLDSMARGQATCIGLSILLVAACRAVGVPARIAGTPAWTSGRGNGGTHEWVEVWDGGWHYLGAAEPYSEGFDHAWFSEEAAKALRDHPLHAIYAVSYRRTGTRFPLPWAPRERWVEAENVSDRYAAAWNGGRGRKVRLAVEVLEPSRRRIPAVVTLQVHEHPATWAGLASEDPSRPLVFEIRRRVPAEGYRLTVSHAGRTRVVDLLAGSQPEQRVEVVLD